MSTTSSTKTNDGDHGIKVANAVTLVIYNKYILRHILSYVRQANLFALGNAVAKMVAPRHKLAVYHSFPVLPIKSRRYHQCNDVDWLCLNGYYSLLMYKLQKRGDPLRFTELSLGYMAKDAPIECIEAVIELFSRSTAHHQGPLYAKLKDAVEAAARAHRFNVVVQLYKQMRTSKSATIGQDTALQSIIEALDQVAINGGRVEPPPDFLAMITFLLDRLGRHHKPYQDNIVNAVLKSRHAPVIRLIFERIHVVPGGAYRMLLNAMQAADNDPPLLQYLMTSGKIEPNLVDFQIYLDVCFRHPIKGVAQLRAIEYLVNCHLESETSRHVSLDTCMTKVKSRLASLDEQEELLLVFLELSLNYLDKRPSTAIDRMFKRHCRSLPFTQYVVKFCLECELQDDLHRVFVRLCKTSTVDHLMLVQQQAPQDTRANKSAAGSNSHNILTSKAGSLAVLEYLHHEMAVPLNKRSLEMAIKRGSVEMVRYHMASARITVDSSILNTVLDNNDIAMLDLLLIDASILTGGADQVYLYNVAKYYSELSNYLTGGSRLGEEDLSRVYQCACYYGFLDTVREIHRVHPDCFYTSNKALDNAVIGLQDDVVDFILANRKEAFSVVSWTTCGQTGDLRLFNKIADRSKITFMFDLMHEAFINGNMELIRYIVENGYLSTQLDSECKYIKLAIYNNQHKVIKYFLEQVKPCAQDVWRMVENRTDKLYHVHESTWDIILEYIKSIEPSGQVDAKYLFKHNTSLFDHLRLIGRINVNHYTKLRSMF
ncbi:hypothetical protein SAMD00019534_037550, partial [Acytostelium subglobosum LB1]|uniref:hypothetical protein n=1 Tax=Acytostelium subglobosum LB1 TaxID=1410327 RepID=UPI000644FDFE